MAPFKYTVNLGVADIALAGLQIWIHDRQFPDSEDYYDGNWLIVTARCVAHGAEVWANGAILSVSDIAGWLAELEEMHKSIAGNARLAGYEPELRVELQGNILGQISMRVEITPDYMTQEHRFEFGVDQSYLLDLIRSCRKVMLKYPLRGKPNAYGSITSN